MPVPVSVTDSLRTRPSDPIARSQLVERCRCREQANDHEQSVRETAG
jgi:hypothetical protein